MINILLVDDELQLLEITKAFLESLTEIDAETALSAKEAVEKLRTARYDAIVSDYQMPGMDGIEFLRSIRSRYDPTPFILFTGKGREEVVIDALNAGVDFYLQKGGDPRAQFAELANMIEKAVKRRRLEMEIIENEEKFKTIFNSANDAIYIIDPSGHFLEINDIGCIWLGYSREEMLQKGISDVDTEQYVSLIAERMDAVMQKGHALFDVEWLTKQGTLIPCEVSARRITYAGKPAILGVARDISERKRNEELLLEKEIKFSTVADHTYDWEYWIAPEGNIIYCSPSCKRISGYSSDEVSRDPRLILDMVYPDDRHLLVDHIETEKRVESSHFDFRIVTQEGEIRWISHNCRAVFDDTGKHIGRRVSNRDITKRKQVEEALRSNEQKLSLILNNMTDAVWLLDLELKFVWMSPSISRGSGFTMEEFNDIPVEKQMEPGSYRKVMEFLRAKLTPENLNDPNGKIDFVGELGFYKKNGDVQWLDVVSTLIRDEHGMPTGILMVGRDVSDRKRALDALQEERDKLTSLVNSISEEVWFADKRGRFTLANPSALREFGLERIDEGIDVAEFASRLEVLRTDGSKRPVEEAPPLRALKGEVVRSEGEIIRTPSTGELRYRQVDSAPVRDAKGDIIGSVSVVRDSTDHIRKGQEIQACEKRFYELFNNIESGIVVYEATEEGEDFIIRDFNAKAESIEGVRKADVVGKSVKEAFPGAVAMGMTDVLRSVWRTGKKKYLSKALYTSTSGPSSWRENLVFKLPNGEVVAVYGDITERKMMEDELRIRKGVFEESIAAMTMADEKGVLIQVNDAFLNYLGFSGREEVLGRTISDFMSDQLEMQAIMKQLDLAGRWQGEYHAKRKDGSNILVHGIATVLKDEDGKAIGYHTTAIDITDHKSGQEISSSTNVKLNILSNITVHDIQNQVVVLNGLVYKAKHANSPVQVKEYLSRIQQVADKIQSHVAFARDYQNLGKAPPSWIRLDTGIMDLTTKFDSKWVQFEANLGSLEVYSDAMLNRAFYNLIDDTLKHGQKATRIKFSAKPRGEDLVLVYEDNGVGVPMERKKSIFEKASSSQKVHGLVLVREILGITGMTIVENGEPGKGARFEILVPKGNFRYPGNDQPRSS